MALVIDTCELDTGRILEVTATRRATVEPFDSTRALRKLSRYLSPDESRWDQERFSIGALDEETTRFVRLKPERLFARDLSYHPGRPRANGDR